MDPFKAGQVSLVLGTTSRIPRFDTLLSLRTDAELCTAQVMVTPTFAPGPLISATNETTSGSEQPIEAPLASMRSIEVLGEVFEGFLATDGSRPKNMPFYWTSLENEIAPAQPWRLGMASSEGCQLLPYHRHL
jgi:hypothetical protein